MALPKKRKNKRLLPHSDTGGFEANAEAAGPDGSVAFVFGLDEVGRGCIAGPVTAACYAFPVGFSPAFAEPPVRIFDSKQLNESQREEASLWLRSQTECVYSVQYASVEEIDKINILRASQLAMVRAFEDCCKQLSARLGREALAGARHLLRVDGNLLPERFRALPDSFQVEAVVKGDAKSFAIAAAAILAKVERDNLMCKLAEEFPAYVWNENAGYPTPAHKAAVKTHGPSSWHRRSFNLEF